MSLINQMLKDLEARKSESQQDKPLFEGTLLSIPPEGRDPPLFWSRFKRWGVIALFAIIAVTLGLFWMLNGIKTPTLVPPPISETEKIIPPPSPPLATTPSPVQPESAVLPAEPMEILEDKNLKEAIQTIKNALQSERNELKQLAGESSSSPETDSSTSASGEAKEATSEKVEAPPAPQPPAKKVLKVKPRISKEEEAEQVYQQGLQLAERGQLPAAVVQLTKSINLWPRHHPAREALVSLQIKRGFWGEAKAVVDEGRKLAPTYLPFVKLRARIYLAEKNHLQALELLKLYAPPVLQDPEYHAFMAAIYQQIGQSDRAAILYHTVLEVRPEEARWRMGLGMALESMNRKEEALRAYSEALEGKGLNPAAVQYVKERLRALKEENAGRG